MIECLFYTCLILNSGLMEQLESVYQEVGENEFVGYVDEEHFYHQGTQSINGKIIWINKDLDLKEMNGKTIIHSHPNNTINNLFGLICRPSKKDFIAKELLGGKTQYLYCGSGRLISF